MIYELIIIAIISILEAEAINHIKRPDQSATFKIQTESQLQGWNDFRVQEKRYVYVGVRTCVGTCHNNAKTGYQYDLWKKSPHSESYTSLSSEKALRYSKKARINENPQESLTCLKCHVTGSGLGPTSFGNTYTKEEGVTCEACHKSEFITITSWKDGKHVNTDDLQPDENTCLKCHNNSIHKIRKFNYQSTFPKISHKKINI
jgi:hypothetical protein